MFKSSVSPLASRRGLRLLCGTLLLCGVAACGYKGPLFLPPPEDPPASLTVPPQGDTVEPAATIEN